MMSDKRELSSNHHDAWFTTERSAEVQLLLATNPALSEISRAIVDIKSETQQREALDKYLREYPGIELMKLE